MKTTSITFAVFMLLNSQNTECKFIQKKIKQLAQTQLQHDMDEHYDMNAKEVMAMFDKNNDGTITRGEVLQALRHHCKRDKQCYQQAMKEFDLVDSNEDNKMDVDEVIAHFDEQHYDEYDEEYDEEYDDEHDDHCDCEEKREERDEERERAIEELHRIESAKDFIYHFDQNGDMNITPEEMYAKLEPICGDDKACYMEAMQAFHEVDQDKNGVLSAEEVIEAIDEPRQRDYEQERALEEFNELESAKDYIGFFDENRDMKITRDELHDAMEPICQDNEECYEHANQAFDEADTSGDGVVDIEELIQVVDVPREEEYRKQRALEELQEIRSAKDVMRFFDENGDMKITREELYNAMEPICGDDKECYEQAMMGFDKANLNGDDVVDVEEVIQAVDVPREREYRKEQLLKELQQIRSAKDVMRSFDLNGDSKITREEVMEKLKPLCQKNKECYLQAMKTFDEMDKNGNGVAEVEEVIEHVDK